MSAVNPEAIRQRQLWNTAAHAWDHYHEWQLRMLFPCIEWCCRAIALAPDTRVLDVACGAGLPALVMAERVAPGGQVMAVDVAPDMLRSCARRARQQGLAHVAFGRMDAETLGFADASFDAVTCCFGLMFCPDPVRAIAEMKRVLKPGGRFAFTVWDTPSRNSFLSVFGRAVAQVLALPRPERTAPGPFRFAHAGDLDEALSAGGFASFRVESLPMPIEYESVSAYEESSQALAAGLRARLDALTTDERTLLSNLVREGARPFLHADGLRFTATPLCASGYS